MDSTDTRWLPELTPKVWRDLTATYRRRWRLALRLFDAQGRVTAPYAKLGRPDRLACQQTRVFAVEEALRWGEASVAACSCGRFLWAIPLMRNARTLGGIAAEAPEATVLGPKASHFDIRRACADLRELVEEANLTNAAFLAARRQHYQYEQERAYALHALKCHGGHDELRSLYLREEPSLFSAIRAGDRGHAREVLNRVLVALYHRAAGDLERVKSLLLELVVSMARTAVEAGGKPEAFLGANYASMTALAAVSTEEALSDWLRQTLNHLMDEVERQRKTRGRAQSALFDALAYMERHLDGTITRADAAGAAHLSPSHFSMLVRKETGVTFKEWLNRMRVDRAAQLLTRTDRKLAAIALECGFDDQSYFTKVFKRHRRQSPLAFRRDHRSGQEASGRTPLS